MITQSKKILVLVGGSYISGAEKITLDVLKGLKQNGHQLHCIVSGWNDGDFVGRLKALDISFSTIKLGWFYTSNLRWTLDSLIHYPKGVLDFLRIRKKFKADIVYTASFRQIALLYPFFKKNIFYHVHDPNANSRQSIFFLNKVSNKVSKFIAVSNFIKTDLLQCGIEDKKISVIYNGVEILPIENENKGSKQLQTIGIVGQIIPRKGHDIIIEALDLLHKQNIHIKLIIVGKGDNEFEALIKIKVKNYGLEKWVEWRGFVKDIDKIYEGIDVILAATQNEEPFGLMACEANMLGKPAIVSNKGGLPEIIQNGINGIVVNNPLDAVAFANAIKNLYDNPDQLHEMGVKGRQICLENFSVDQMNQGIHELFSIN